MKKIMKHSIVWGTILLLVYIVMIGCDAKLTSPSEDDVVSNLKVEKEEDGKVKLSWNYTVTTDDTLEYHIYRKIGEADFSGEAIDYSTYENRFYYDEISTNDNSIYAYRIAIYNVSTDKFMPFSDVVAYFSPETNPTDLIVEQIEQNSVSITWIDVCIGEEGYYVDKKEGEGSWQNQIATLAANSTTYTDSTSLFQTFSYRVRPFYGSDSADGAIATILPILPVPTGLSVTHSTTDIFRLSWDDNSEGEEGFEVQRKIGHLDWGDVSPWNETLFSELETTENVTFVDDDLSLLYFQAADISYRVRAFQGEYYSEWSDVLETKIRLNDIGQIQTNDVVKDISIYRDLYDFSYTAYLANNYDGVKVLDISTPNNPSEVVNYELPDRTNGVYVKGNVLYALFQEGGFTMQDIEDYNDPQHIGTVSIPGVLNSIYVYGVTNNIPVGYAFVARGQNGLSIVDFGEGPPHIIGTISGLDAKKIFVPEDNDNYAYVAVGTTGGFRVIDISNPGAYSIDYSYDTSGSAQDIFVEGSHAYLANGYAGFEIIDVSTLGSMNAISSVEISGFVSRVIIKHEHAFVLDSNFGLYVINITDKENPFVQGSYPMESNPTAFDVVGSYIYVALESEVKIIQVFE